MGGRIALATPTSVAVGRRPGPVRHRRLGESHPGRGAGGRPPVGRRRLRVALGVAAFVTLALLGSGLLLRRRGTSR